MNGYLHRGSGAYVELDHNGKKRIHKHKMIFKSFLELYEFERDASFKKNESKKDIISKDDYLRSKGEF